MLPALLSWFKLVYGRVVWTQQHALYTRTTRKELKIPNSKQQLGVYCSIWLILCTYLYIGTENTNVTQFICQLFLSVHLLKLESDTDFNFQSRWNFLHDTYHGRKQILGSNPKSIKYIFNFKGGVLYKKIASQDTF